MEKTVQTNLFNPDSKTEIEQGNTDSQSTITVGDRVSIKDCPGHWNWASPFTVEAIGGGMVKLELVSELVKIARLSKCLE